MKNENLIILERFVEAIQEDYEKVPEERKRKILISLTEITGLLISEEESSFLKAFQSDDDVRLIGTIQSEWVKFLKWMVDVKSPIFAVDFQISARATIDRSAFFSFSEDMKYSELCHKARAILWDKKASGDDIPHEKIIEISVPPGAFKFFRLLSGCSVDVLLKCPTCGKIFVNKTKRKMIYHSPACRTLSNVQKFRSKKRD